MFAVYADAPNPDDPLAALVAGERPELVAPEGWVSVRVKAASVNMHDLWTMRGVGIKAEDFPMILGMDAAGETEDGTRVVVHPVINEPAWQGDETLDPRRSLLTERHQGTFAETVIVPCRNVIRLPESFTFGDGAALGTAWLTAYRMLFTKAGVRPGQTVLVQGASGGVSTALIQLGRAAGLRVWTTGRTEAKRELAHRLGSHAVFEPGARLPEKVDAVFESVGEASWAHSMRALRPGGAIICCGATSGPNPPADLQRLFFLQLRVEGSTMGTRAEFVDLLNFMADKEIRPHIGMHIPMSEARTGFEAMAAGETEGKIVLEGIAYEGDSDAG
ncbi:MAG: zinc-binding dehydrogenase [Tetrasphaera sp.]